jgi:hypothetical protein
MISFIARWFWRYPYPIYNLSSITNISITLTKVELREYQETVAICLPLLKPMLSISINGSSVGNAKGTETI